MFIADITNTYPYSYFHIILQLELVGAGQALQRLSFVFSVLAEFIFTKIASCVVLSEQPCAILFLNTLPHSVHICKNQKFGILMRS